MSLCRQTICCPLWFDYILHCSGAKTWASRLDNEIDVMPEAEQEEDDEDLQKALQVVLSRSCSSLQHLLPLSSACCGAITVWSFRIAMQTSLLA